MTPDVAVSGVMLATAPEDDPAASVLVERYHVREQAEVQLGDPVATLRSDRYVYDVGAKSDGVVTRLCAAEGDAIEIGAPLLEIEPITSAAGPSGSASRTAGEHVRTTPLARNIAKLHRCAIEAIQPSGVDGRIRAADVYRLLPPEVAGGGQNHAGVPTWGSDDPNIEPQPSGAGSSGDHATAVPRALFAFNVDVHDVISEAEPDEEQGDRGEDFRLAGLLAYATLISLREHPMLNSAWTDAGIVLYRNIRLRCILERPDGIIETSIPDAGGWSRAGLQRALVAAARARPKPARYMAGPLPPSCVIILAGQSTEWRWAPAYAAACGVILSISAPERRPVVVEMPAGPGIAVRAEVVFTLACDARYISHAVLGAFMRSVRRYVKAAAQVC